MIDKKLIKEIHITMENYFICDKISHEVAQDFSYTELEKFIQTYFHYLLK